MRCPHSIHIVEYNKFQHSPSLNIDVIIWLVQTSDGNSVDPGRTAEMHRPIRMYTDSQQCRHTDKCNKMFLNIHQENKTCNGFADGTDHFGRKSFSTQPGS